MVQNGTLLEERLSLYEKHNPALFVRQHILQSEDQAVPETARIARGEIGHVHPDVSIASLAPTLGLDMAFLSPTGFTCLVTLSHGNATSQT